ncbi:MAG: YihY family inner membrane protein [Lysobacterales bacterium]|jgi:membrane protein
METESVSVTQLRPDRLKRLASHVWCHFQEDRCFEEAASLSYTSLLAMVPLLAVVFGVISVFPVFNKWSEKLQSFIFDNFLPATGQQIVPQITTFLDSVSGLTLPGTIMLIITALLLMIRIEVAFNRIWRVDRSRSFTNRIIVYWAVLTLGPLLIAAAIALSAQRIFGDASALDAWPPALNGVGTFLLSALFFTLVFLLVPNRRVRIKHAVAGAVLSAVLFGLAKSGFVAYVSNANYKVIYGALATVPIFLFWLYIVWIVVLLGASLAASLTTFSDSARHRSQWPERWEFQLVYRLVGHLLGAQASGTALSREELLDLEPRAGELQIVRLMQQLRSARVVTRDEEGNWVLVRDLDGMTLGGLYAIGDYFLPLSEVQQLPDDSPWDEAFIEWLREARQTGGDVWSRDLKAMYSTSGKEPHTS